MILSLVLMMGFVPSAVFAAPIEGLWVNGVNILTAENNTVACGSGTAVYDPTTATIILIR
ncbi:MAG: hypothetical protein PHH84_03855 [Oscillospiraceae bacterium]|nr:hypothetical protein [Oscillospiraceae bacterium]